MLDYIKRQLQVQNAIAKKEKATQEYHPDEDPVILTEYAHIFQELDDLTVDGEDDGLTRKLAIDIPLDDDLELDNIEFNLTDGRITDIPMDATVQEARYQNVKSYDQFLQEAYQSTSRLTRESDTTYRERCAEKAKKEYNLYQEHMMLMNIGGNKKIGMDDNRVPSSITADFGSMGEDDNRRFCTKLKVMFETDNKHQLTQKQLDSVDFVQKHNVFANMTQAIRDQVNSMTGIPKGAGLWDVVTPTRVMVANGPVDRFGVVLEYTNDLNNQKYYYGWSHVVNQNGNDDIYTESMQSMLIGDPNQYENKLDYMNRPKVEAPQYSRFSRYDDDDIDDYYQEAIDFGDASGDAGTTDGGDTSTDDTNATGEQPVNPADGNAPQDGESGKEDVDTNNVSDEIAEKVSDQTTNQPPVGDGPEITFDDDMGSPEGDMGDAGEAGDASMDGMVNDKLNELDDMSGGASLDDYAAGEDIGMSGGIDDSGMPDIENMSIDDLITNGSEKLKSMTIGQLRNFLASNDNAAIQEAFFQEAETSINQELDTALKTVLGILNDDKMDLDGIVDAFKNKGKELNTILIKAGKDDKTYSETERGDLNKLNEVLGKLIVEMRASKDENYVITLKADIKLFVAQSKVVGKIVDAHKGANATVAESVVQKTRDEIIQEAFINPKKVNEQIHSAINKVENATRNLVKGIEEKRVTPSDIKKFTSINLFGGDMKMGTDIRKLSKLVSEVSDKADKDNSKISKIYSSEEAENLKQLSVRLEKFDSDCSNVAKGNDPTKVDAVLKSGNDVLQQMETVKKFTQAKYDEDQKAKNDKASKLKNKALHTLDQGVANATGVDTPTAKAKWENKAEKKPIPLVQDINAEPTKEGFDFGALDEELIQEAFILTPGNVKNKLLAETQAVLPMINTFMDKMNDNTIQNNHQLVNVSKQRDATDTTRSAVDLFGVKWENNASIGNRLNMKKLYRTTSTIIKKFDSLKTGFTSTEAAAVLDFCKEYNTFYQQFTATLKSKSGGAIELPNLKKLTKTTYQKARALVQKVSGGVTNNG